MAVKLWSQLSARTQKRYTKQGVTPSRYNAYAKKTASQKLYLKKGLGISREEFLTSKLTPKELTSFEARAKHAEKLARENAEYYIKELRSHGLYPNVDLIYKVSRENALPYSKVPKSLFKKMAAERQWQGIDWDEWEDHEIEQSFFWYH